MPPTAAPAFIVFASAMLLAACGETNEPVAAPVAPSAAPSSPDASLPQAPAPAPSRGDAAPTSTDSPATDPKGALSAQEESRSMPMAGHGNNHSSPSLESPSKN